MAMNASNSSNLEQLALKGLINVVANLTEKLHKMFSVPIHHALHTRISVFHCLPVILAIQNIWQAS